ncbi:MAG: glycosyltransferase [Oscillospiraceae bacterium]|nr:glycosyltransferase [Oscillospiraceae bacterium]
MKNNIAPPEVSIIVPVYNTSKYVKRCLRSLIEQDFDRSYEIIVVNDGSTDDSLKIVEAIAARYDIVKVYSRENGGLSAARNTGLEYACGKYVMFTDSDDFVDRRYISMMHRAAESSDADIVCCNFRTVNERGVPSGLDGILHHRTGAFTAHKMLRSLLLDITIRNFAWNKLYRRSLFMDHNIRYPAGKIYEDMYTTPRLFYHSKKIAVVSGVLYNYVQHSGSITGTITPKKVFKYINAYGGIREFLDEENAYEKYKWPFRFQGIKIGCIVLPMLVGCKRRDNSLKLGKSCKQAVRRLYRSAVGGVRPSRSSCPTCPKKTKNVGKPSV